MTQEIERIVIIPDPPPRVQLRRDLWFLVQAAFWWVFMRPFEQIQQTLNEMSKAKDEYTNHKNDTR